MEKNLDSNTRLQVSINIIDYPEYPWKVIFWNSIYHRDQGILEIYG